MLGLATLRRDGFVSLDAGKEEGYLLTKPLMIDNQELHINVDASCGYLVIIITDDQGYQIDGYTSPYITGDHLNLNVTFDRPIEELMGKKVRLKFQLKKSSLYSYWFI
jgi:hypothetical protein